MLPTPSTSHITSTSIYPPSEDTYLFLDTLSSPAENSFLQERFSLLSPSPLLVEVGTGSGAVLAFLIAHGQQILGRSDVAALGTDINWYACVGARGTVRRAMIEAHSGDGGYLASVCADLGSCLKENSVDVLLFNPPYVPTDEVPMPTADEQSLIELSWAGGEEGMQVTQKLLDDLPRLLSKRGVAYVLLCKQNRPEDVRSRLKAHGWNVTIAGSSGKKAGWEKLVVIRIWQD
ncbi:MAG: hypothetical protein Q9227_008007 [Pyrenula ochraceoflavens]